MIIEVVSSLRLGDAAGRSPTAIKALVSQRAGAAGDAVSEMWLLRGKKGSSVAESLTKKAA